MESQLVEPISETIEIPDNQKYILCLLNSQGKPIKYIVFNGNSTPMTDEQIKQKLFSKDGERDNFDTIDPQPEFHNSSQQIHKDDTIRTIKKKIIHELGKNEVCYEELYIFGQQYSSIDPVKVIDQYKGLFNGKIMSQFAINIQLKETYYDELILLNKSVYNYEDLTKYINKTEKYNISIPLGQRFSNYSDLLFSGNPYDIELRKNDPTPVFQISKNNELYTFENQLLLNYGDIHNNVIYICKAGDVFDYADAINYSFSDGSTIVKSKIDQSFLIELYFPLLYKAEITNKDTFIEKHQQFIERNQSLLKPGTIQLFDTIDLFYNIYNSNKSELNYIESGISEFNIVLHPDTEIPIPLDIIFKQSHATLGSEQPYCPFIPMIKYNPGKRREVMFRFYSEFTSKDGRKIPWLQKKTINTISRDNKKLNQIIFYIKYTTIKKENIDIFVEINANGNIRVRSILNSLISTNVLETIIYNVVNPIIIKINKIVEKSGYKLRRFDKLTDENVEVVDLKYQSSIQSKNVNFKKVLGCLTSMFDIMDTELDVSKGIMLNFIRVDNYQKMNAISATITEVFKRTNSQTEIIETLITNFSLSRESAMNEIINFFNQHQRIHGQYVNKQIDIVDNPGFPVSIYKSPFDNKLQIKVDQINAIQFIEIIHIYMDSILRMLLFPEDIHTSLKIKISMLCSKINKIDEDKIENIIVNKKTTIIEPIIFPQGSVDEELGSDNEEDKYLPMDEDDSEGEGEETISSSDSSSSSSSEEEEEEGYLPKEPSDEEDEEGYLSEEKIVEDKEVEDEDKEEGYLPEETIVEDKEVEDEDKEEGYLPEETIVEDKEVEDEDKEEAYLPEEPSVEEVEEEEGYLHEEPSVEEVEDEEEGYLPEEVDSTKSSIEKKGGEVKEEKANIFTKRMKEKEPNLILTKPQGKFVSYSRICPANASLQPVILTDEEKNEIDKEHSGAYTNAIKYGSDPKNQFWYICPRYWCLKTNKPMTEDEVKRGECGGKIIPDNSKPPPPNHFIFEFTDPKYHKDENGKYVWHSPGFKPSHSHPDSKLCLPCCYSAWATKGKALSQQQTRRQQCGLIDVNTNKTGPDGKKSQISLQAVPAEGIENKPVMTLAKPQEDEGVKKEKEKKKQKSKNNVLGIERYPIQQYRWGFLPTPVEKFLHTNNNKYVMKSDPAYIMNGKRPLLRYGVEQSLHQSFIGVLSDIYSSYAKIDLLTISEMRQKIVELLGLDDYLKLHNGSMTAIFKPNKYTIDDVSVENYKNTFFYSQIDSYDPLQYAFLKDSISSFENFKNYLKDPDSMIDHTYLWDIISSDESVLFNGGLNLVIMEIVYNDITDNIDILCPTNSYSSNIYKKDRGTILILKHDNFYEPIYLYEGKEKENAKHKISENPVKIFTDLSSTDELKTIRKVLNMVMETSGRKCKPMKTRPQTYTFKENISVTVLLQKVTDIGLTVKAQVMNYNGKVIALLVEIKENQIIYLPCFPSSQLSKINTIFMYSVQWLDYVTTRDLLNKVSSDSNGSILCKPIMKVMEDEMIIGLLTETNQFIQIAGPEADTFEDGLPLFIGVGYKDSKLDVSLAISKQEDDMRIDTVRSIRLETQFYSAFRTEIRNLLNDYNYREIREQIIGVLDNPKFLYSLKMKKLDILVRYLTRNILLFVDDIDGEIKQKIGELSNCNSGSCDVKSFCLKRHGKACFPNKNLINPETFNDSFYFTRVCDELIRYKRIRLFMFDNKRYLNISNIDYSINEDEVLLMNSILTDKYFEDLEPFQNNKYVKNITYEIAAPSKRTGFYQNFSNKVPLNEQNIEK
jgi:hypothetical protein